MNRVRAGFFSVGPPEPLVDDGYLRWHALDHLPEQYSLPGVVLGTRWLADSDCVRHRITAAGEFQQLGGVVNYLFSEPVQQTYDDFMDLGAHLAEAGRFPIRRPSLHLRLLELAHWRAAPRVQVSAEVVPFRPHRGVLLIIEQPHADSDDELSEWWSWLDTEHGPALLDRPGVAGAWTYVATDRWSLRPNCEGGHEAVTVIYLDDDPVAATARLIPVVEQRWTSGVMRPLFAGPLRSMIKWDAWPD